MEKPGISAELGYPDLIFPLTGSNLEGTGRVE